MSYLGFLKWKRGRKVEEVTTLTDTDTTGLVEVRVYGDGNSVHVHNNVYKLSENAKALRATRDAFLPLGHDGFDKIQLKQNDLVVDEIGNADVEHIVASCNAGIEESKETEPEIEATPAWLSVYSPVYDLNAVNWRFRLGKEIIYADISDTNIAEEALGRGGVAVDDAYQVNLQITTEVDVRGVKKSPVYKILRVIRFVAAQPVPKQTSLFDDPNEE